MAERPETQAILDSAGLDETPAEDAQPQPAESTAETEVQPEAEEETQPEQEMGDQEETQPEKLFLGKYKTEEEAEKGHHELERAYHDSRETLKQRDEVIATLLGREQAPAQPAPSPEQENQQFWQEFTVSGPQVIRKMVADAAKSQLASLQSDLNAMKINHELQHRLGDQYESMKMPVLKAYEQNPHFFNDPTNGVQRAITYAYGLIRDEIEGKAKETAAAETKQNILDKRNAATARPTGGAHAASTPQYSQAHLARTMKLIGIAQPTLSEAEVRKQAIEQLSGK